MNRMGKITLSVLAVAVLLVPVCLSDVYATEGEGADTPATGPFDIKDQLGDCTVSMSQANTEESVLKWIKDTWLKGIKWDDPTKFPAALGLTAGYDSNLTVTKTAGTGFKAAVAGTPGDKDGTAGSLTFDITDSNNKVEAKGVVCTITTVFDDSSVPCQVLMEDYNAEDTVLAWLNTTWVPQYKAAKGTPATTDLTVIKTKDTVFKPAVAGTKDSKAGTDGSLTFDIVQTVGTGSTTIASGLICTVKAYGYGEITSSDKDVIFEGGLVDGLRVDSKDHELTSDEIGMIIASLGGSNPVMSSDVDPSNVSVYDNVLRIQDGDEEHVYVSGDVVRFEGKEYIIQIGDREFSLYLIDGTGWMKFDRVTFEQTYAEDGRYECSTELFPLNIRGSPYLVRYSVLDRSSPVDTGDSYLCFLYTLDGKAAGYVGFSGKDVRDIASDDRFVMNASIPKGTPVAAIFDDPEGKKAVLSIIASKDVSFTRNGAEYKAEGTIRIPLGSVSGTVSFVSLGTDACTPYTVTSTELSYEASCPSDAGMPLVATSHSPLSGDITVLDLEFPESGDGDGGTDTKLYIAAVVAVILVIGAAFYYVRFLKP